MKIIKNSFILFTFIFLTSILFSSCSVNDYTGLIRITNRTQSDLLNVKIGNTLLAYKVTPGNYVDYWYLSEISGNLNADGISVRATQKDFTFILKTNYWVDITASTDFSGSDELYIQAKKVGGTLSPTDWIE